MWLGDEQQANGIDNAIGVVCDLRSKRSTFSEITPEQLPLVTFYRLNPPSAVPHRSAHIIAWRGPDCPTVRSEQTPYLGTLLVHICKDFRKEAPTGADRSMIFDQPGPPAGVPIRTGAVVDLEVAAPSPCTNNSTGAPNS